MEFVSFIFNQYIDYTFYNLLFINFLSVFIKMDIFNIAILKAFLGVAEDFATKVLSVA